MRRKNHRSGSIFPGKAEEPQRLTNILSAIIHGLGAIFGIYALVYMVVLSAQNGNAWAVVASAIYGASLIILYTISTLSHALTNRSANVRIAPLTNADVAIQLKKNTEVMILDKYQDGKTVWYEIAAEKGTVYGFVRDYVIDVSELNEGIEAKTYVKPEKPAEETDGEAE